MVLRMALGDAWSSDSRSGLNLDCVDQLFLSNQESPIKSREKYNIHLPCCFSLKNAGNSERCLVHVETGDLSESSGTGTKQPRY